ncbi:MAG: amidohydrolase family protein [Leptolyngbyaceae cyanobacterium MAG.088]|nr:amidohydrolase family protein [Leptolyngbyaceae cyanobacterium MAG.088]
MDSPTAPVLNIGRILDFPGQHSTTKPVSIRFSHDLIETISYVPEQDVAKLSEEQLGLLALPALVNAHDHGRGLASYAFGALDQALELWLPALKLKPQLSVYSLSALALAKMARGGVGAVVHCHNPSGGDLLAESLAVCQAARDVGMRLALALPLCDRNFLAYGTPERLLELLPDNKREQVLKTWNPPTLTPQEQVDRVHNIAAECEGDLIHIQYCPRGPQWCSEELLETIAVASANTGRRIHTHLFETKYQREWGDAHYPQGLLNYLDTIGFLSPRLTLAHGAWLRPAELDLLAERGVIISVNTSSNLRLRSGLAPYRAMLQAGISTAFGLDGMSLNDNEDAFEELRLNYHIHSEPGIESGLTSIDLFNSHRNGVTAVTNNPNGGLLKPGEPADIVVLDYGAMTQDMVPDVCNVAETVLMRGAQRYVKSLWVAGRQVVDEGQVLGVDEAALQAEVQTLLRSQANHVYSLQPLVNQYQQALRQFYREGRHTIT